MTVSLNIFIRAICLGLELSLDLRIGSIQDKDREKKKDSLGNGKKQGCWTPWERRWIDFLSYMCTYCHFCSSCSRMLLELQIVLPMHESDSANSPRNSGSWKDPSFVQQLPFWSPQRRALTPFYSIAWLYFFKNPQHTQLGRGYIKLTDEIEDTIFGVGDRS